MKAIRYHCYGGPGVLQQVEVPLPEPAEGEVRVRVHAVGVNPYEWHYLRGEPLFMRAQSGWRAPKDPRLGVDLSGVVDEVGPGVTRWRPGDEVFGAGSGTLAEYALAPASLLAPKPAATSFVEAAGVPLAGVTALQAVRDHGGVESGQRVLVVGASGGVGGFAVQIARELGAEVTAVSRPGNADAVRDLGVPDVIDYEAATADSSLFDVVVDVSGVLPVALLRRRLPRDGTLVVVGGPRGGRLLGPAAHVFGASLRAALRRERTITVEWRWDGEDLAYLGGLLEAGRLKVRVDRTFPLGEAAAAVDHVERGLARGKVVVTVL